MQRAKSIVTDIFVFDIMTARCEKGNTFAASLSEENPLPVLNLFLDTFYTYAHTILQ